MSGFTLSEVLLVLSVIGVVAALTIPTIVQKIGDSQNKVAYKKIFSVASQAWLTASAKGLIAERTIVNDQVVNCANFNAFKSEFNVIKECYSNNNGNCWNSSGEKFTSNRPLNDSFAFVDSSGVVWSMRCVASGCNGGYILADINGDKSPNIYGIDRFAFKATNDQGGTSDTGLPTRITPFEDFVSSDSNFCPSGNCKYQSWLYE